jgi:MFS transporter, DHA2 family, multidrug resistance protein
VAAAKQGDGAGQGGWTGERSAAGDRNPWLIATVISISAFMEVLDTAIANVSLRHIAGATSSTYDQATWVLTSYLVANAIVIPLSSWLSNVIGRKRYYMGSVALFSLASLCCGLAPNLPFLIGARIVQGLAGGGLQPSTQSMLVDTFPPQKRGQAMAMFGFTVILAPTIGPVLGGFITDHFSWHWIFLINVPVGMLSLVLVQAFVDEPKVLVEEREQRLRRGIRLDTVGFMLIAVGLGALEITMDRGEREDWFQSPFIWLTAIVAAAGLLTFVIWELSDREPLLDLTLFKNRNFAAATFIIMIVGVILFGTTQFMPQLLQQVLGYTATSAGLAMTAGGAVTLLAMPVAGALSNRVPARYLLGFALVVEAFALWNLTRLNTQMTFADAAIARMWQALGIPFMFVPLTTIAYIGLPRSASSQASALLNVGRNIGGSIGISAVQSFLTTRQQFYQARYTETLNPLNPAYSSGIEHISHALIGRGQSQLQASHTAVGLVYQALLKQVSMLAFIDCFWVLMVFVAVITPTIFLFRSGPDTGEPARSTA